MTSLSYVEPSEVGGQGASKKMGLFPTSVEQFFSENQRIFSRMSQVGVQGLFRGLLSPKRAANRVPGLHVLLFEAAGGPDARSPWLCSETLLGRSGLQQRLSHHSNSQIRHRR